MQASEKLFFMGWKGMAQVVELQQEALSSKSSIAKKKKKKKKERKNLNKTKN
jgi:hypothetical protein